MYFNFQRLHNSEATAGTTHDDRQRFVSKDFWLPHHHRGQQVQKKPVHVQPLLRVSPVVKNSESLFFQIPY